MPLQIQRRRWTQAKHTYYVLEIIFFLGFKYLSRYFTYKTDERESPKKADVMKDKR